MRLQKIFFTVCIGLAGFIGDYVVFSSKYSESFIFRAAADSTVHATIGFMSASLFFSHRLNIPLATCMYNVLICTLVSSLIDIDHVFVAKSIYIKDLTNLKQRGIFHCTTFWLLLTSILLAYSYISKKLNLLTVTYMLVIAFTSHHIRDANRRGFWMYPFGHTRVINKYIYVLLSAVLPYFLAFMFSYMKQSFNVNEYTLVQTV